MSPGIRFIYVSGAGTDADGRQMWARVKGETENELLTLPFEAFMFITTEQIGRAMVAVAEDGAPNQILGNREIGLLAAG